MFMPLFHQTPAATVGSICIQQVIFSMEQNSKMSYFLILPIAFDISEGQMSDKEEIEWKTNAARLKVSSLFLTTKTHVAVLSSWGAQYQSLPI